MQNFEPPPSYSLEEKCKNSRTCDCYKIFLVGPVRSGKTSIINFFTHDNRLLNSGVEGATSSIYFSKHYYIACSNGTLKAITFIDTPGLFESSSGTTRQAEALRIIFDGMMNLVETGVWLIGVVNRETLSSQNLGRIIYLFQTLYRNKVPIFILQTGLDIKEDYDVFNNKLTPFIEIKVKLQTVESEYSLKIKNENIVGCCFSNRARDFEQLKSLSKEKLDGLLYQNLNRQPVTFPATKCSTLMWMTFQIRLKFIVFLFYSEPSKIFSDGPKIHINEFRRYLQIVFSIDNDECNKVLDELKKLHNKLQHGDRSVVYRMAFDREHED